MAVQNPTEIKEKIHDYLDRHVTGVKTRRIDKYFEDVEYDQICSALSNLQDEGAAINTTSYNADEISPDDVWRWKAR